MSTNYKFSVIAMRFERTGQEFILKFISSWSAVAGCPDRQFVKFCYLQRIWGAKRAVIQSFSEVT